MTYETYDDLGMYLGNKPVPNELWIRLIAESFGVSNSVAKDMLHAMLLTKAIKSVTI